MTKNTKGFYTVEAAVIMPMVIIAVLTLSYLIGIEATWENVMNGVADETQYCMLKGYDGVTPVTVKSRIRERVIRENSNLSGFDISWAPSGASADKEVGAYRINAEVRLSMPFGLGDEFTLEAFVKYRNFSGSRNGDGGMGRKAMETDSDGKAVVIFPQEGEKYHGENCTYAVAKVQSRVLTDELRSEYGPCGLCKSKDMETGSIVYCFRTKGTAYHRESCRSIDRRTLTMARKEAEKKGYEPCSKCGGN